MNTLSLEEFLKAMAERPRTFGWDAVLAFDRSKTNLLLMQEYIDRFDTASYFPPLTSEIEVAENIKHDLVGLVLDKPRLSFENADIKESKARLALRMVGGKQMQISETVVGENVIRKPTRLALINAVAGPSLLMDIQLNVVEGNVDSAGKVVLNLAQGVDYRFTGVATEFERLKLGLHMQAEFDKWDDSRKRFQLSELVASGDELLQPERFGIRTQPAPGAAVRGSQNFGEGVVLLFVAMRGSEGANPSYPPSNGDMLYLLPDASTPYSSNLVLGHNFLWQNLVLAKLKETEWLQDAKLIDREQAGKPAREVVATAGGRRHTVFQTGLPFGGLVKSSPLVCPFVNADSSKSLRLWLENDRLKFTWAGTATGNVDATYATNPGAVPPSYRNVNRDITVTWELLQSFRFVVGHEEGRPVLKLELEDDIQSVTVEPTSQFDVPDMVRNVINGHLDGYKRFMTIDLQRLHTVLQGMSTTLDAFRLNNLLFRSQSAVQPRDVHWPADLTTLGDLAPDRTRMTITTPEMIVAAGQSHAFRVEPATSGVQWKVDNLPGESGDKGSIDSNGRYTAPSASSLHSDGFRRVVITASQGGRVSKALVSLVESEVSVYPSLVILGFGGEHAVSAGSVDNAKLAWTLNANALGTLAADPDADPHMQDSRLYKAPALIPKPEPGKPIFDRFVRLDTIEVAPAAGGAAERIDVVIAAPSMGTYWVDAQAHGDTGVQLKFWYTNRDYERVEVPASQAVWHVVKGGGTLTQQGLYTPDPASGDHYAVIAAFRDRDDDEGYPWAYMVVPVPFMSVKRFVGLLNAPKGAGK